MGFTAVLHPSFTYGPTNRTTVYLTRDNLLRTPLSSRYHACEDRVRFTRTPYRSIAVGVQGRF